MPRLASDKQSASRYLATIFAIPVALCLCLAGFNWLQGVFWLFKPPVLRGFNDVPPLKYWAEAPRDIQYANLRNDVLKPSFSVYLMGTSHVLRGFSTCEYPNMMRVAMSEMSIEYMHALMIDALSAHSRPLTFAVEVSVSGKPPFARPQARWLDLLSARMTYISLHTWKASHIFAEQRGNGPPGCVIEPSPVRSIPNLTPAVIQTEELHRRLQQVDLSALGELLATFGQACLGGGDHQLRLFMLPLEPLTMAHPEIQAHSARESAKIEQLVREKTEQFPGCRFSFLNFRSRNLRNVSDESDWFDRSHFKPQLGERLLKHLLKF